MAQLAQRFGFNLADAFTRYVVHFANFLQGAFVTVQKAEAIKLARIDGDSLSEESLKRVKAAIVESERLLAGLLSRAVNMVNQGRISELQEDASQIGMTLLRAGYYNVDAIQPGLSHKCIEIGRNLHLVETMPVFIDGGRSLSAVIERIQKSSEALTALVGQLSLSVV